MRIKIAIAALLMTAVCVLTPRAEGRKQVLILNAYNEAAPWAQTIITPIMQEISSMRNFSAVKVANLNGIIVHNETDFKTMAEGVFDRYSGDRRPDYLVLVGNFAFTLRDMIKENWGDIPMLLIAQNDKYGPLEYYYTYTTDSIPPDEVVDGRLLRPLAELRDDYNFTLVLTPNKHKETVDMMMYMYPEMKRLVFMGDALYINRHLSHVLREYIEFKYPDVEFEWLIANSQGSEKMQAYLNNPDPDLGLLLSTWYYESRGIRGYPQMNSGDSYLIAGAHRPVFGLRDAYFRYGVTGGYFASPEEISANIRRGLEALVSDSDMREVPFMRPERAYPIVDYRQMERDGIKADLCPPNTVFMDKPTTFWDEYGYYVLACAVACLLLIVILVSYIVMQKRSQKLRVQYDSLVDSMPIGYMQATVRRDKTGKVISLAYALENPAFKEMLNHNGFENPAQIYPMEKWRGIIDTLMQSGRPITHIMNLQQTDTHIEFILSVDSARQKSELKIDVFAIDVSDKMKVEHILREAARKAVEADNMKSAFLANMSHEIRTPLNAIVGFSNLLCRTEDRSKKEKFMEIIETNNELLLKLIGDILDISKAESDSMVYNMVTVDVNSSLRTIKNSFDLKLKPGVSLNLVFGMEKCLVTYDPYRLTQVVNNLITNAIKFTERGSITVGYEQRGDMLYFYVKDTGVGISEVDMPKLFTRFTKLNAFMQGTGLGLSICKTIVGKLGGTMGAESEGRGKGSLFWFTIPYKLDESEEIDATTPEDLKVMELKKSKVVREAIDDEGKNIKNEEPRRRKILIVEDNEGNYLLYKEYLEDRFELVHAWDGAEGVSLFERENPDLILMDINLPVMNGYEATEAIRRLSKRVPIIGATAYAQNSDRKKVLSSGFNAYISKPIDETELISTIGKYLK